MKILLVENEQEVADQIQTTLTNQQYLVDVATDSQTGLSLAELFDYNLIILELGLPGINGLEFCQQRRQAGDRSLILIITLQEDSEGKIKALQAGADDYLFKPLDNGGLLAHIQALLRRQQPQEPVIEWQGLRLDGKSREAFYYGQPLFLTTTEYAILELFIYNRNRIFSQSALVQHLWSWEEMPSEQKVRTYIHNLHAKLRQVGTPYNLIETVYGLGYRFTSIIPSHLKSTIISPSQPHQLSDAVPTSLPNAKVATIFQHYKDHYLKKIYLLQDATHALAENRLHESLRQQAILEAHTLSGSLGLFGFRLAAEKCRQLETIFQAETPPDSVIVIYLNKLVNWLRQEVEQENEPPLTKPLSHARQNSRTPYILIVDDDIPLAQVLLAEAQSWGMEANAVQSPAQARKAIAVNRPDVVVLDLCFPEDQENGLDLLSELTTSDPPIPVLVSTVEEGLSERLKVAQLGGQGFLSKPVSPEQMMEAISQLLEQVIPPVGKVMIVDDNLETLELLSNLLEPWGFSLTLLQESLHFWDNLQQTNPDLLILDVQMPGFSGVDLCQIVRNDPKWNEIPILMLSDYRDADTIEQVFAVGADDYINKPIIGPELISRILNRLERNQMRRRLAEIDSLTGLSNRRKSLQDLHRLLNLAKRQKQSFCFVLLDLDYFKNINDKYGHDAGDRVLRQLGKMLKQYFRGEDIVGRWGGEEFALGMYGMNKQQGIKRLTNILEEWRKQEFQGVNHQIFSLTFSAGVAVYPQDGAELQILYRIADKALYRAKAEGRNKVCE